MIKHNLSNAEYHRSPGVSSSLLKLMAERTPAHARYAQLHPRDEPTPAMRFGSLVHTLTLEPETYAQRYAVMPEFSGKGSQAAKRQWLLEHQGLEPVSGDDALRAAACAQAVHEHPVAHTLLADIDAEPSVFWSEKQLTESLDSEFVLQCRIRPDALPHGHRVIADLKTAVDASLSAFSRATVNYGYHLQDALYRRGMAAIGQPVEHFIFIVVESQPPHCVALYEIPDAPDDYGTNWRTIGEVRINHLLRQWAECEATDNWPGYPVDVRPLSLPKWAKTEGVK